MSIYTKEKLIEMVQALPPEKAKVAFTNVLRRSLSNAARSQIARVLTGSNRVDVEKNLCQIDDERVIPYKTLEALVRSPMADYVKEIITAALHPQGPFQSREILLRAAQMRGGRAPFIEAKGIPQKYMNQAGYILSMAGFIRDSHYDRERRMPVKAWKLRPGYKDITTEQRVELVFSTMRMALADARQVDVPKPQPIQQNTLESFI